MQIIIISNGTAEILVFNLQQDYTLTALPTIGYPTNVQEPQLGIPHPKTTLKDTSPSNNLEGHLTFKQLEGYLTFKQLEGYLTFNTLFKNKLTTMKLSKE